MTQQLDFTLMVLPESALAKRGPKHKRHGYAAPPGSGPTGETCKSCKNLTRKVLAGTFLKCALMSAHWTGGYGTDVLARSPACRRWDKKAT